MGDGRTVVTRKSDVELVATRTFAAPPRIVYQAWTSSELFKRWWAPKSMGVPIQTCEMDVRVGGGYRIAFGHDPAQTHAFYGKYLEVVPNQKIVWTNEESGDQGAISTVTFEEKDGKTLLTYTERYPTKEALDESIGGMEGGLPEQFGQLDELLATMA